MNKRVGMNSPDAENAQILSDAKAVELKYEKGMGRLRIRFKGLVGRYEYGKKQ